jgi:DNA modification methylase
MNPDCVNTIICDDVLLGLKKIPDNSVTLVITSPPYNVAASKWSYDTAADDQPYLEYIKWLTSIWMECYRVLRPGGRLIINIDAMTNRQEDKQDEYIRDIRTDIAVDAKKLGFKFYGEHVWYKSSKDPSFNGGQFNGKKTAWGSYMMPSTPAVRRNHEYILVYSKTQFKLEPDKDSGAPDITGKEFQTYIASVWWMNAETRNLGNHPVPFPEDLPYRLIKLYSYPNDIILDPFNGTGTTTVIAKKTGRRYIGIDMSADYCRYAENRMSADINLYDDFNPVKIEVKKDEFVDVPTGFAFAQSECF